MVKFRVRLLLLSLSCFILFSKIFGNKSTQSDDADLYCHGFYWEPEPVPEAAGETFPQAAAPLGVAAEVLAVASVAAAAEVLAAAALRGGW